MTSIDNYFGEFLDNEDNEQEQNSKPLQDMRSGVIFLIDCTPTMLGLHGSFDLNSSNTVDSSSVKSGFDLSLLCCQTFQQNKALHSPFDMTGLVLMRTNESSVEMKNIMVLQPLVETVKTDELEKRYGTIVNQPNITFPLHEALWVCQNQFITCSKTFGIKHIFLLTDDPDPVNKNANLKRRAIAKMADMKQYGIELEVIPIKQQNTKFDYELFYDELLEDELIYPDLDKSSYHPDPTERLDELLSRINSHELRRSRLARLPFHLGSSKNLTLGISVYCLVYPTRIPSPIWLSSSDNKIVLRGIKLDGRYICFDKDELTEAVRNIAPVGLHLLGFISQKFLKRYYYIRPAHFIYPDEKSIHGSRLWFTALLNRCLHRKLLAIAIYVQRKGQFPRLVALLPQAEQINDDDDDDDNDGANRTQTIPPGFHIIFLPYADDFRDIEIPTNEIANESQVDIAKAMIRKLMVPFTPGQIENPTLQRFYSLLEALALNRETQSEVVDHTLPKFGAIKRRASEEITAFKECFNLNNESIFKYGTPQHCPLMTLQWLNAKLSSLTVNT
ncbi:unnamed protein product [Schistosoma mattheei]|uniref:Ku domain-containing protein n=1 Tax=Schistosoma mattheei TaxID=31246 RepID=A0AA85BVY5_9TREM|nr:unnamed protein product [Schistosoma mattheei]